MTATTGVTQAQALSALSPSFATVVSGVSSAALNNGFGLSALAGATRQGLAAFAPIPAPSANLRATLFNQGWRAS
jgi:hypothetical protein